MINTTYRRCSALFAKNRLAGVVSAALLCTYANVIDAQPSDGFQLEEVVVTARKRAESLNRVPEAVSVVGGVELEDKGISSLEGIQHMIPSFSFNQFQDAATVYLSIRGVNSIRTGEPPVAMVVDGVQINDPAQINQQLNDIDRIEVLKGPQGSLYGRNAIGGAVNIVTREPSNELSAKIRGSVANGNDREINGVVSGSIVDDVLTYRVGGGIRDFDGLIDNVHLNEKADSSEDESFYGKLLYTPSDNTTVVLRGSHFYSDYDSYYYKLAGIGLTNHEEDFDVQNSSHGTSKREHDDVSLKLDHSLGFADLTSITGYSKNTQFRMGDLDFTPRHETEVGQRFINRAISEEIRLTSNADGNLQWVAGAFYMRKNQRLTDVAYAGPDLLDFVDALPYQLNASFDEYFGLPNLPGSFIFKRTDFHFRSRAYALFGQADYSFSDQWQLTLGMRYDVEERKVTNPAPTILFNAPVPADQDVAPVRQETFKEMQPKLTLSYTPAEDHLVYGTVSKGFRSGGFNNSLRPEFASYKPETLWNYELGAKSTLMDGQLYLEGAIFYMDYENRQDFFFNSLDVTQNIFNVDKSRIYGAELSFTAKPIDGLTLRGGIGLLDTEITEFDETLLRLIDPDPSHTAEGNHFSYVYHTSFNLSAQYSFNITSEVSATLGVDYSHQSDNWWWYTNLEKQKPLDLVNARFIVEYGDLEFKLYSDNLFNVDYVTSHDPHYAFGFPEDDVYPAEPRRYGLSITYRM